MTIFHQIAIKESASEVYAAIAVPETIGTWWDEQKLVESEQGLVLEHNPGKRHGVVRLRVIDRTPNERIEWECISTHPQDSPASAWTGTRFVFELSEDQSPASITERECSVARAENATITTLNFRQIGYDENTKYYGFNNFAWGQVLQNLKQVIESRRS